MKKLLLVMILLFTLLLFACDNSEINRSPKTSEEVTMTETIETQANTSIPTNTPSTVEDEIKYGEVLVEWGEYYDAKGLAEACTHVFEGKVVNVSFVVKENTSYNSNRLDKDGGLALFTIYEIQPTKIYKGEPAQTYTFEMWGGIHIAGHDVYREDEQKALLKEHGLKTFYTLHSKPYEKPYSEEYLYLFALREGSDGVLRIINSLQYVYRISFNGRDYNEYGDKKWRNEIIACFE